MVEERQAIFERCKALGTPVWVAEHSRPDLKALDLQAVQLACLRAVRACPEFICVLDGSYGSAWDSSEISILELEIFMAALSGRCVHVVYVEPFDIDPRLGSLLAAVRSCAAAKLHEHATPRVGLSQHIGQIVAEPPQTGHILLNAFVQWMAKRRFHFSLITRRSVDVQYIDGSLAPFPGVDLATDQIALLLADAQSTYAIPDRIARLWTVFRHLSHFSYTRDLTTDQADLWQAFFAAWGRSAAWYGLHGHLFLGRLAAVSSGRLLALRTSSGTDRSIQISSGALASEYYSIAKSLPSPFMRFLLRLRALQLVNEAIACAEADDAGLHAIRGSIYLHMARPVSAIRDYSYVVEVRRAGNFDAGEVGEAEVELGYAYFLMRRIVRAEALLVEGVAKMRHANRPEFFVRALRKLGDFYSRTSRVAEAREAVLEALQVADANELEGQISQLQPFAMTLGIDESMWRNQPRANGT